MLIALLCMHICSGAMGVNNLSKVTAVVRLQLPLHNINLLKQVMRQAVQVQQAHLTHSYSQVI